MHRITHAGELTAGQCKTALAQSRLQFPLGESLPLFLLQQGLELKHRL